MKNSPIYLFVIFIVTFGLFVFSIIYFQPRFIEKEIVIKTPTYYKVVNVIDGDTIEVEISDKQELVRLIGINTPEVDSPYTKQECFGPEASDYAKKLLDTKEVYLIPDSNGPNRDKYNRLLRYVFLPNGLFINAEILKNGFAYNYIYEPFEFTKQFDFWEKKAKESKIGLWGECK